MLTHECRDFSGTSESGKGVETEVCCACVCQYFGSSSFKEQNVCFSYTILGLGTILNNNAHNHNNFYELFVTPEKLKERLTMFKSV